MTRLKNITDTDRDVSKKWSLVSPNCNGFFIEGDEFMFWWKEEKNPWNYTSGEHFSVTTYVAEMFLSRSFLLVSGNINHLEEDRELLGDRQKSGKYSILLNTHTCTHFGQHILKHGTPLRQCAPCGENIEQVRPNDWHISGRTNEILLRILQIFD